MPLPDRIPGGLGVYLQNIVEDTTPELGGTLDCNSFGIDEILKLGLVDVWPTETIAGGVLSGDQSVIEIAGQGAAADELDTITHVAGVDWIFFRIAADADDITLKHNTGNIYIKGGADIVFGNTEEIGLLIWNNDDSKWGLISGGGGAGSDTTAIHDNVGSEILGIAQDTAPIGTHEILTENAAGTKKAVPLVNLAYGNPPLGQAGNVLWTNRTYEGWEIFDTPDSFDIGGGAPDFATLALAAAAFKGLILTADLTLSLAANATLTANVIFDSLISAGGELIIDLNGNDLEIDDGVAFAGVSCEGPFGLRIKDVATGGSVKSVNTSDNPPYYLLRCGNSSILTLDTIVLDANNNAITSLVTVSEGRVHLDQCTYSNVGNLTGDEVYATGASYIAVRAPDPVSTGAAFGAIIVLATGVIVTSGGTITPV